jgi:hypothetical protein
LSERNYPDELTPELERVLGLMNFRTGPIAHILQAAGRDIPKKAEAEQAHVLHWLIKLALDHPDDWSDRADAEIRAMVATLDERAG